MQSSQAHERSTPNDDRSRREVGVVVYHFKNRSKRFHLWVSRGLDDSEKGKGDNTVEGAFWRVRDRFYVPENVFTPYSQGQSSEASI